MASPETIDIESFLQPISEESPTGSDVRENPSPTSTYQTLKAALNQARTIERNDFDGSKAHEAMEQWRQIESLASKILKEESKDLEVATSLIQAAVRRQGYAGLRDAFKVTKGLVENFFDNLYPLPDEEEGMEARVYCVTGLNGSVMEVPIRLIEITQGDSPGPFNQSQYKQAAAASAIADEQARKSKIESMGYSLEDIDRAVDESSEQFYVDLRDDISECIESCKGMSSALDERCGHDAPSVRAIIETLEECLGTVKHIGKLKFPIEAEAEEEPAEGEAGAEELAGGGQIAQKVVAKGPIASRDDAFKQLKEIADYFKKTEPHSPISYVLQKAVKWGGMSLGELISELIPDQTSRAHFSELTGVQPEAEDS